MTTIDETSPRPEFDWQRQPAAEALVDRLVASALSGNAFAAELARRMEDETSTRFVDWVDHLVLTETDGLTAELEAVGYRREWQGNYAVNVPVFGHEGGLFPRLAVASGTGPEVREVAIKVESVADFSRAHDLGLEIVGYAMGPYRVGRVPGAEDEPGGGRAAGLSGLRAVPERPRPRGADGAADGPGRAWRPATSGTGGSVGSTTTRRVSTRPRRPWSGSSSFAEARRTWRATSSSRWSGTTGSRGTGRRRCRKGGRTGSGSAGRTTTTTPSAARGGSSRGSSGSSSGWGSSSASASTPGRTPAGGRRCWSTRSRGSSSSPTSTWPPRRSTTDFAHQALPDLPRPNTVGLWVGLHGESMLEAGMHHLEAQFDFDALRDDLQTEAGIVTMKPFSDFPFLRQAFTAGRALAGRPSTGGPLAPEGLDRRRAACPVPRARGRSGATWRTSSVGRATRGSTSRPSARSSRRPTRGFSG